jgi:CheY-like chemotaxis protein
MAIGFDARRLAAGAGGYAIELGLAAFAAAVLTFVVLPQAHGVARILTVAAIVAVAVQAVASFARARRARRANAAMADAAAAIESAGRTTVAVLDALKGEVIPSLDKTLSVAGAMTADRRLSASVRGRIGAIQASSEETLAILQAFVRQPHEAAEEVEPAYVAMAPAAPSPRFEPLAQSADGAVEDDEAYEAEAIFPDRASADGAPSLDGLRVLVGESNGVHQLVLRTHFAQFGAEAEIFSDGVEVMEAWRNGGWDLILLDVQMPGMDGLEAARMIRSMEARFGWLPTPIVALAPDASPRQVAACAEAGIYACAGKPIAGDSLLAAIDAAFAAPAEPFIELPAQITRVA